MFNGKPKRYPGPMMDWKEIPIYTNSPTSHHPKTNPSNVENQILIKNLILRYCKM